MDHATYHRARKVFEETLTTCQQQYALEADAMVEATLTNADGQTVVVARYKLFTDGHWQCFEILDDVLWPNP